MSNYTSCTDCTHLYYDKGYGYNHDSYSVKSIYLSCEKKHWNCVNIEFEIDFRSAMRKALTCQDFKASTLRELETGLLSSSIGKPTTFPASPVDREMAEAFRVNLELKKSLKGKRKKP